MLPRGSSSQSPCHREIARSPVGVQLTVTDDGAGVSDGGGSGLGSQLYATLGAWNLQARESHGTVLTIEVRDQTG